jgi:predicted 3-demethylubiquinone-9 3-methyltransferase (glyoxalase superfamily)
MPKTIPCLWFDGQAEDAAKLYTSLFPNSKITSVVPYGPDTPGTEGTVMLVSFELDGQPYVALNGGPEFTFSEAVSFQIVVADQAELDHYWDGLIAGGGEPGPCGWLKDRFGLSWQVVPKLFLDVMDAGDEARGQRAFQAVLKMHKPDIAEIQRAADAVPAG